ncbi:FAD-dependent monooxygenase [Actinomadura yumaensis]|uniref:FAD-dependent monooxygenase n=1 Tax=Actinomadura yumaensis TaxID=111807 RepID=UPI00361E7D61
MIGADGYRSVVRRAMFPDVRPEYAGYVLWRGTFPAALLDGPLAAAWPAADAITIGIPRGHALAFRIPGADGDIVNWGLYAVPPPSAARLVDPTTLPPGSVTGELMAHFARLVEEHLPPDWARIVRLTPPGELYVQPIYDLSLPALASGRLLLAGDAAACARPHTGGGAVKALQDAVALEDAWRAAATWDELRTAYDSARAPGARAIVDLGRRLGHAQVPAAPDWTAMDAEALDAWWGEISSAGGFGGLSLRRD